MRRLLSVVSTLFLVLTLVLPTAGFGQEATPVVDTDQVIELEPEPTVEDSSTPGDYDNDVIPSETAEPTALPSEIPATSEDLLETPSPTMEPVQEITLTETPTVTEEPEATIDPNEGESAAPELDADSLPATPDVTESDSNEDDLDRETDSSILPATPASTPFSTMSNPLASEAVTVTIQPTVTRAGAVVTVIGTGFEPGERVDISWLDFIHLGHVTAKADGTTVGRVTVPADAGRDEPHAYAIWMEGTDRTRKGYANVTVLAAPSISVSPASGMRGDRVAVSGANFPPNQRVNFRWGGADGEILGYKTSSLSGTVSGAILVPANASSGSTLIYLQSGSATASGSFTVIAPPSPTISVSPTSGVQGDRVSVSGTNFPPNQRVNFRWGSANGEILGYKNATSSGTISGAVLVPDGASAGSVRIYLQRGATTSSGIFTVTAPPTATISISPTSGVQGDRVSVSGTNFPPNQRVNFRWGSANGEIVGYKNATSSGTISGVILVPDGASAGSVRIYLQRGATTSSGIFTVLTPPSPTISISPTSGVQGDRVSVSGTNFPPNQRVNFRWGSANGEILGYKNATSSGTISGAVLVPDGASAGSVRIYLQRGATTSSGTFTVTVPPQANISVSNDLVTHGEIISIQGYNYQPGETVTITLPGGITLGRVSVGSDGTFSGRIKIPATLPQGFYTITARGSSGSSDGIRVEVWGFVLAEVQLNPSSGAAGSVMRFTGSGFQPGERVTISWLDTDVLGTVTASPAGMISGAVTIPRTAISRSSSVWFEGQSSDQYDIQYFDVTRTLNPTATVSPTSSDGGEIVSITGSNYRPGETVTIYWGERYGPILGIVTSTGSGNISGRITIPKTALAGAHSIVLVGNKGYTPVTRTVIVTSSPVVKVTLSSTSGPANNIIYISGSGFRPDEIVQITWGSVNGESMGSAWADQNGVFTNWTILTPWDSSLGTYRIYAVGELSKRTTSTTYNVTRTLIHRDSVRYTYSPARIAHIQAIS